MTSPSTTEPVYVLRGSNTGISSVHFSAPIHIDSDQDGSFLLASGSSGSDGCTRVWSTRRRRVEHEWKHVTLPNAPDGILKVHFTHKHQLVTQARDGTIECWDMQQQATTMTLATQSWSFCPFSTLDDNDMKDDEHNLLLAPTAEPAIMRLYDARQQQPLHTIDCEAIMHKLLPQQQTTNNNGGGGGGDEKRFGMVMSNRLIRNTGGTNEVWMLIGGEGGRVLMVSTRMPSQQYAYVDAVPNVPVMDIGIMQRNASYRCIVASPQSMIPVFKLDMSACRFTTIDTSTVKLPYAGTSCISVRSDQKIYAVGAWDHSVRVFECRHVNRPLAVLKYHQCSVQTVDFATIAPHCPPLLASAGKDGRIAVYSMYPPPKAKNTS